MAEMWQSRSDVQLVAGLLLAVVFSSLAARPHAQVYTNCQGTRTSMDQYMRLLSYMRIPLYPAIGYLHLEGYVSCSLQPFCISHPVHLRVLSCAAVSAQA